MASSSAAGSGAVDQIGLEKLYQKLWVCDVKKDHGADYDRGILENILPSLTADISDSYSKEELFHEVCGVPNLYNDLTNNKLNHSDIKGIIREAFSETRTTYSRIFT